MIAKRVENSFRGKLEGRLNLLSWLIECSIKQLHHLHFSRTSIERKNAPLLATCNLVERHQYSISKNSVQLLMTVDFIWNLQMQNRNLLRMQFLHIYFLSRLVKQVRNSIVAIIINLVSMQIASNSCTSYLLEIVINIEGMEVDLPIIYL